MSASPASPEQPGDGPSGAELVQQAVEEFVRLHSAGKRPEPLAFADEYDEALRERIVTQCREFLAFDGVLGHQEWQEPDADDEPDGRLFGDFVIEEELGRGGMGVVYLARQRSLGRRVALKVMASGLTLSKRHVERFRREAMATAQLRHPAIVPVHSFVEEDGSFGLAMEYVAGRTLADLLADLSLKNRPDHTGVEGTLGIAPDKGYVAECAILAAQVASALAAAHAAKIVHRDLKPQNLMLDDRRQIRLLDFGLAKSLEPENAGLSMSGEVTGTLHYLSPEQTLANRVAVDERSDVWSLGVILYQLLTLTRPFDGRNMPQIFSAICFKEPTPIQRLNPRVPRDLATICGKALEKDPNRRYQTAAEFEADLQRFLNWEPVRAKPTGALGRASKFLRRHRAASAIAAGLALTATTIGGVLYFQRAEAARRADVLMAEAAADAEAGAFADAIVKTNSALELRNDEVTRERLDRYHAQKQGVESEAARKVAESARLMGFDQEGALARALDAHSVLATPATRSATLSALGGGIAARSLPALQGASTRSMSVSPSGAHVAVSGSNGALKVLAIGDKGATTDLRGHAERVDVSAVAFLDDDQLISLGFDGSLKRWRRSTGRAEASVELSRFAAYGMHLDARRQRALLLLQDRETGQWGAQARDARTLAAAGPFVAHGRLLMGTAFSPDGEVAACCNTAKRLRVWRVTDGEVLVDRPLPHEMVASALAMSADCALVAAGDRSGQLAVLAATDGALVARGRHASFVSALTFAPDGRRLLSGSTDFTTRLWSFDPDARDQPLRETSTLGGDQTPVQSVAFDSSGTLAATACGTNNTVLRIYDCSSGGPKRALFEHRIGDKVREVAFLAGDRELLALTTRRPVVWGFLQRRGVTELHQPGKVQGIAFVADGERLASTGDDEHLRVWSRRDGRLIWQTPALGMPVEALAVDDEEQRIAAALVGGDLRLYAAGDGSALTELRGAAHHVRAMFFLGPEGLLTAGTGRDKQTGQVTVWDLGQGAPTARAELPRAVLSAALSPDAATLATVVEGADRVQLWKLPEVERIGDVPVTGSRAQAVTFHPETGDLLLVCEDGSASVHHLDGSLDIQFQTTAATGDATYSRDGRFLLTCSRGGEARLLRAADAREELRFDPDGTPLLCGAFSPDGAWAATSYKNGSIRIWPTDPVGVGRTELHGAASPPDGR